MGIFPFNFLLHTKGVFLHAYCDTTFTLNAFLVLTETDWFYSVATGNCNGLCSMGWSVVELQSRLTL